MNKEEGTGKKFKIFGIAILIIFLDQLSKVIVSSSMELNQSMPVIKNIFHLTYIFNTGAGFGILKGQNTLLIFIAIAVIGTVLFYYKKIPKESIVQYSIGLILSGAVGNLIDRIRVGYVIDFIDFRIWPSFNVADSAITVGTVLLIIYLWRKR